MAAYLLAVILYTAAALALTGLLHGEWQQTVSDFLRVALTISRSVFDIQVKAILIALPILWWFWRGKQASQLRPVVLVAVAAGILQIGFFFTKAAIPSLVPFYADPFLADLERSILLGRDAWEVSHAITPSVLADWFPTIYTTMWSILAYAFPIFVVATDRDALRVRRYIWLFFLTWLVVGNVLAIAGSSVGPVYYDRLLGTERFAAMHESFEVIGYASGSMAQLQDRLWEVSGERLSFISAFPSVHVAVAFVASLYIRERYRRLWPLGDLFLALILLVSVYSGYHYLLDGIASIGIVLALNALLRRFGQSDLKGNEALELVPAPLAEEKDLAKAKARSAHLP
jgi:hypothetical protein